MKIDNKKHILEYKTIQYSFYETPVFNPMFSGSSRFFLNSTIYLMNRIRKNKEKLLVMMGPKMVRLLQKIKKDYTNLYFKLTPEEKDIVVLSICTLIFNTTISFLNNYTQEEIPDLLEVSITNLELLEEDFVSNEMYSYAQMMRDSILKLQDDIHMLAEQQS